MVGISSGMGRVMRNYSVVRDNEDVSVCSVRRAWEWELFACCVAEYDLHNDTATGNTQTHFILVSHHFSNNKMLIDHQWGAIHSYTFNVAVKFSLICESEGVMNELCHNLRPVTSDRPVMCLEKALMFGEKPRIDSQTLETETVVRLARIRTHLRERHDHCQWLLCFNHETCYC